MLFLYLLRKRAVADWAGRLFLERYQNCTDAEHVSRVQETIMEEGEREWEERRKPKEKDGDGGDDLLVRNPNHIHEDEEPLESDVDDEDNVSTHSVLPHR